VGFNFFMALHMNFKSLGLVRRNRRGPHSDGPKGEKVACLMKKGKGRGDGMLANIIENLSRFSSVSYDKQH